MTEWKSGYPGTVNCWYKCRVEGQEVPLYLVHCNIKDTLKWLMDDGRTYAEVDEPVEWAEPIRYVPRFNRF